MSTIAIIGAGNVGGALARRLANTPHKVLLCASSPESASLVAFESTDRVTVTPLKEAVEAASIVVLAVPFTAVSDIVSANGAELFAGKLVVDVTNPLTADFMGLTVGHTTSAGELIADLLPQATVVKAFNTVMAATLQTPIEGAKQFLPVASDDADATATVVALGRELGFDAIDAGPLSNARYLEPTVELLIQLAFGKGLGPDIALTLARPNAA